MKKKLLLVLFSVWILLCVIFIFFKGMFPGWQEERSDFSNYYASSVLLLKGEAISSFYDNNWFTEKAINEGIKGGAKFAPFPPATAFLYLPLTIFPALQAKRIWLICNLLFLVFLVFQVKSISTLDVLKISLILSLFSIPIASNIRLGQSYLFFTMLLLFFLQALKSKKNILAGSLLGIAASFKYFPIIYFLYVIKAKNKTTIGLLSAIAFIFLLPILVNGIAPYQSFLNVFFNHLNGDLSGQVKFSFTFQSIDALLANLFIYDAQLNPQAIFNSPNLKIAFKLFFAVGVILLSVNTYKNGTPKTRDLTIGTCIVGAALLIPASATYHLLFLFPAILLVLNFLKKEGNSKKEIIIILLLTFITCNLLPHHIPHFELNHSINTLLHFPRLYGLMTLFATLFFIQKRQIQTHC